jgi:DNA-binding transcriptional LysR family regulator
VYETRNKQRASEILGVSRAAVGQNVNELSRQLGVNLFTAHRRGVNPTGEASNMYPNIKRALETVDGVEDGLKTFTAESAGHIKMALSSLHIEYIKDYLKTFTEKYPRVVLEFFSQEDMSLLRQGNLDLILTSDHAAHSYFSNETNITRPLFDIQYTFIAEKNFLKKRGLGTELSRDELLGLPIISQRVPWEDLSGQINAQISPFVFKVASAETVLSLAKIGLGVGYYSRDLFDRAAPNNMVCLNVHDIKLPTTKIVCVHGRSLSRPARIFIDGLRSFKI